MTKIIKSCLGFKKNMKTRSVKKWYIKIFKMELKIMLHNLTFHPFSILYCTISEEE